jgi:DinB superfamily
MSSRLQRACCIEWGARAAHLLERAEALPDDAESLRRPSSAGGWSAARVLEHLVLASGSYLAVMRPCVEAPPRHGTATELLWRPTLAGRALSWSMTSAMRFPAPSVWMPNVAPRPHVRDAWIANLRELHALLDRAEGLPWNRMRFRSPAATLLRLNLGDGFLIQVAHAERHFGQIDRVLAADPMAGDR